MKLKYYTVALCAIAVLSTLSPVPARAETSEQTSMLSLIQSLMSQVNTLRLQLFAQQSEYLSTEALAAVVNTRISSSTAAFAVERAYEAHADLANAIASSSASTPPDVLAAAEALLQKSQERLVVAEESLLIGRFSLAYAAAIKAKQYAEEGIALLEAGAI